MRGGNMKYKIQGKMETGYSPIVEQSASSANQFFYETSAMKNNIGDVMKNGGMYICNNYL